MRNFFKNIFKAAKAKFSDVTPSVPLYGGIETKSPFFPSTTRMFLTAKQSSKFAEAVALTLPSPG